MSRASKRAAKRVRQRYAIDAHEGEDHAAQQTTTVPQEVQPSLSCKASAVSPMVRPSSPRLKLLLVLFLGITAGFVLSAALICGLVVTALPHVYVLPPENSVDPLRPYASPFSLRNAGTLPVFAVEIQCTPQSSIMRTLRNIKKGEGVHLPGTMHLAISRLARGESKPVVCDVVDDSDASGGTAKDLAFDYAELKITTRFRLVPSMPLTWGDTVQVFVTSVEPDGRLRWRKHPAPLQ